jgi:hypothetical protein
MCKTFARNSYGRQLTHILPDTNSYVTGYITTARDLPSKFSHIASSFLISSKPGLAQACGMGFPLQIQAIPCKCSNYYNDYGPLLVYSGFGARNLCSECHAESKASATVRASCSRMRARLNGLLLFVCRERVRRHFAHPIHDLLHR